MGTSRHTDHSVNIDEHKLDVIDEFRYLDDEFTSKGDNSVLCETRAKKSLGTISELISLCKEVHFGKKQLTNVILLYDIKSY